MIEYRVRPLVRFHITRHEIKEDGSSGTRNLGTEYANGDAAFEVAYALARAEAEQLGYAPGDDRMIYPQTPITYRLEPNETYGVEQLVFEGRPPNPHAA